MKQKDIDKIVLNILNEELDKKIKTATKKVINENEEEMVSDGIMSDDMIEAMVDEIMDEMRNEEMGDDETVVDDEMEVEIPMDEKAKPDFLDLDGDGDKKEPMKQAAKDAKNEGKKESKKNVLKLTEEELIDLIEKILVSEEEKAQGLKKQERVHKEDGKVNKKAIGDVGKKMSEYVKNGKFETNPKTFPKGNGQIKDMEKVAYEPSDAVEEYIDAFAYPGMTNLTFDEIAPSDDRVEKYLKGDSTTGNAQVDDDGEALGNVVPDEVGDKFMKNYEDNLYGQEKQRSYKRVKQPVDVAGNEKGDSKLDDLFGTLQKEGKVGKKVLGDIERIKSISGYNEKTQ